MCSVNSTGGIIRSADQSASFNALITPNATFNDGDEAFIEITVKSTSPYTKTLKGRFILKVGKNGLSYKIEDKKNRPYLNLSITNTIDYYLIKTAFGNYSVNDRIDKTTYKSLSEEEKAKCVSAQVTLTFDPNIVIFDMTNSVYLKKDSITTTNIDGFDYINSITFKMEPESSEVVKFYKADTTKNYTYPITNNNSIIDFSITE